MVLELTKFPYFLCLWADDQHYVRQKWLKPSSHNVQFLSYVEPNKMQLPPLHINLGVIKNFVKVMDGEKQRVCFPPREVPTDKHDGILDGLQIRKLMKDLMFDEALSETKMSVWQSLMSVVTNFLGKHRSVEYEKEIGKLLKSLRQLGTGKFSFCGHTWLLSKELWRFDWEAGWALSPRYSHYGRALPSTVGCKLSH